MSDIDLRGSYRKGITPSRETKEVTLSSRTASIKASSLARLVQRIFQLPNISRSNFSTITRICLYHRTLCRHRHISRCDRTTVRNAISTNLSNSIPYRTVYSFSKLLNNTRYLYFLVFDRARREIHYQEPRINRIESDTLLSPTISAEQSNNGEQIIRQSNLASVVRHE